MNDSSGKSVKRKMLAAREDLADKISEIAKRKGTLYDFINETLQEVIRADALGLSLREIIDERGIIKMAKDSGFIFVPERLWYDLIEMAHQHLGRELENLWYENGRWYGRYYGDIEVLKKNLKRIIWDISELDIYSEGDMLIVKCISSKYSRACSMLFGKFLEGAMNSLGYSLVEGDISRSVINLKFKLMKDC